MTQAQDFMDSLIGLPAHTMDEITRLAMAAPGYSGCDDDGDGWTRFTFEDGSSFTWLQEDYEA